MSAGSQQSIQGTLQYFGPRPGVDENRAPNITSYGDTSYLETFFTLGGPANFPNPVSQPVAPLAIPAHSIIWRVYLEATEAATSGGSATLDIGTAKVDGTVIDENGLVAAATVASLAAVGDRVVGAGAQIGVDSGAFDLYLTAQFNTAAFTAGQVRLIIAYSPPSTAQSE